MATREPAAAFPGGDRFELVGELGRGGMGVVYEVLDRDRRVRLALKGLRKVGPRAILRLKHEFRAVRDLQHPNLIRLHELFEDSGAWFFTMELVDGVDFLRWVRPSDARRVPRPDDTSATAATVADGLAARIARVPVTETVEDVVVPRWIAHGPSSLGWSGVDELRLRDALRGLIGGVAALHRAGMVHRDIKPSNILVELDGRVVILDFGVVAEVAGGRADTPTAVREVVGTYAYMAPEQATGDEDVGPAADWYAVGVVLHEALTGVRPFSSRDGIEAKLAGEAPSPRTRCDGLPDDLVGLCERLLRRAPAARPRDAELLAQFGLGLEDNDGPGFIGRAAELATLRAAFDAVVAGGGARAVVVTGESGIGKSALARRFVADLTAAGTNALVLAGRCDERELVSYNALDGAVDALARYLSALPAEQVAAPGGARELLRIFPVLHGVAALDAAGARVAPGAVASGTFALRVDASGGSLDARSLAFAALADLFAAAAARRPVVLLIDDLHWADADSLGLLGELFAGADAPPVLLLATARAAHDGAATARAALQVPVEGLVLGGLAPDEAEALVRATAPGVDAARLAAETRGHPMFLTELARRLGDGGANGLGLDDALWQRIGELDEVARALLEVVALGAAALPLGVVTAAAGLGPEDVAVGVGALRAARLIRVTGSRDHDAIEPYHDRVRETVVARLGADRRRAVHGAIGAGLEATGAAVEVLAYHLAQAGDGARAGALAEAAARRALDALAYDRAAEWLRITLQLGVLAPDRRRELEVEHADVLARAGRTADAADAFLAAAAGQPADAARDLRRRAAEQLLTGGHLVRGRALAQALADEVGLGLPVSTAGAITRLLWYQTRLELSRLAWVPRPDGGADPRARIRVDVAWAVASGLSMVDSTRGVCFALRGPLLALPTGDAFRIARAACGAAVAAAGMHRRRLAERLRDAAHRAAAQTDDPTAATYPAFADVAYLYYLANDWRGTVSACVRAAAALPDRDGLTFEANIIEQHHVWALSTLGELRELRRRVPAAIRSAHRLGNRFVEISHRTFFGVLHLVADHPAEGLADLRDAIAGWHTPDDEMTNPFFFALKSRTLIALYTRAPAADPALADDWARMRASLLFRIPMIRAEACSFAGVLAIAHALAAGDAGDGAGRAHHLASARRWVDRTRRVRLPAAFQLADTLAASHALAAGDDATAAARLSRLIAHLDDTGQRATAAACRWRLAQVVDGSEGAVHQAAADRFFAGEGVVRPDRLVDALLPGL